MSNKHKWIIVGFAWMFLGAVLNILYAVSQLEMSIVDVVLSWGLYGGFVLILLGIFAVVDKPKEEKKEE